MSSRATDGRRTSIIIKCVREVEHRAVIIDEGGYLWLTAPGLAWPQSAESILGLYPAHVDLVLNDQGHVLAVEPSDTGSYVDDDDSPDV